jgi:hypothetical protein
MPAMNWSLIYERNWFLIRGLKDASKMAKSDDFVSKNKPLVVMGVFGAGHVYGIIEQWYIPFWSAHKTLTPFQGIWRRRLI